jgi:hypothetical protein
MRRQHPPVEVVRRLCGVIDGLPLERMAAATIPGTTMVADHCSNAIFKEPQYPYCTGRRQT